MSARLPGWKFVAFASTAVSLLVAHPLSARWNGVESSNDNTISVDIQRTHQILARIAEDIDHHIDRLYLWHLSESLGGGRARTTSLNLSVQSGAANAVTVLPAASVHYQIVGILSDDANQGLALVGFDLVFDGGDLTQADEPDGEPTPGCDNPMVNFTRPWGLTNPAGFGGTVIDGDLIQVGGGQNTIMNGQVPCTTNADCPAGSTCGGTAAGLCDPVAPFPIGPVLLGVAQPSGCGPAILVTGELTAPMQEGVYSLIANEVFANVITADSTGDPFWTTTAAQVGSVTPLVITVRNRPKLRRVQYRRH